MYPKTVEAMGAIKIKMSEGREYPDVKGDGG